MMTIRRVEENGDELVLPVLTVSYNAETRLLSGLTWFGQPYVYGGDGQIYVMNEMGKTVALYNFRKRAEEAARSSR